MANSESYSVNDSPEERFLGLVVIAGLTDRLKAMTIRRDEGTEAALKFLGTVNLTREYIETEIDEETH